MATTTNHYAAAEIKVLEGLDPVRKRPGMYIGSTDARGLHHLAKEILDNAVDEAIGGFGKKIQLFRTAVTDAEHALAKNIPIGAQGITVVDNGRGIPVDMHSSGVSALEVVLTKLHAGGKFEETAYQASGGLHGVGSSAVNALSSVLQVIVKRDNKYYYQYHNRGIPQVKVGVISEAEVLQKFPEQAKEFIAYETGTLLQFVPDPEIFSTTEFNHKTLVEVIKDRAYLMAGIYFEFVDTIESIVQHYYFEGGIRSLVQHINMNRKPLHGVMYAEGFWEDEQTHKKIGVEVALQYNDSYNQRLESYVNVIRTPDGGAHINGFNMAVSKVLRDYAEKTGLLKEKESFTAEDIKEGMTAVVFVKMPSNDLQFESQTKTKLNNSEAQSAVYQVAKEGFATYLEEHPKAGRAIIDKIMLSARARLAARAAKDAVIRKGVLEGSSLPGKLADCQSRNPEESEIYIVEGDSAGGCFSGDTEIALADGRSLSFYDLIREQEQGKEHFCYTIRKTGTVGLERIQNVRRTKQNATVLRITLDTGEAITCTPDHKFMLRDGTYLQADQLTPAHSLMPLYRQYSSKAQPGITIDGYEMVWNPKSDSWLFTHLLADWYNRWQKTYTKDSGSHCHHSDFNKLNNNPTNIVRMSAADHLQLHREHVGKTLHTPESIAKCSKIHKSQAYREKMSERMLEPATRKVLSDQAKQQWENSSYKQFMSKKWKEFFNASPEYRASNAVQLNQAQQEYWSTTEHRKQQSERVTAFFAQHPERKSLLSQQALDQWSDTKLRAWRASATSAQWTPEFRLKRTISLAKTYYQKSLQALKACQAEDGSLDLNKYQAHRRTTNDKTLLKFETFCTRYFEGNEQSASEAVAHYNHKIISVEQLREKIDVYDLEVPHTHNFALASGVFVHNSAKQGRDRKFQAIFPLRGKILNTERARLDKIVAFEELKNLVIALGAGIGETFDPGKLRYHRIILMNDADVDGEHITTLGLTFFFRHLHEVVEQGYLYVAMPPLFKITSGKSEQYAFSDAERDEAVEKIKAENPKAVIGIQRYKGLGEMNPEQLWETTMNPKTRTLKRITIDDLDEADETFSTLMGDDVVPRKKFIQTHAKLAELDV